MLARLHLEYGGTIDKEYKENMRDAIEKWCEINGWQMIKTLDRIELEPNE